MNSQKPLLIFKFGTASIVDADGKLKEPLLIEIARQVSILAKDYRIILVSSGAVSAGKSFIKGYKGEIAQRKAAAAIGNPILIRLYAQYFNAYQLQVAQCLCERRHFADRKQFLQLKQTCESLWKSNVIPIANENDVVSDLELRFSDNDELATLLAAGFGASHLFFCTSVGGILDAKNQIIPAIKVIDASVFNLVNSGKTEQGLGGMASKLSFSKRATTLGIPVTIFGFHKENALLKAVSGEHGTRIHANDKVLNSRQKWLGSGGLIQAKVSIDQGALSALKNRKSLLGVGVIQLFGDFEKGEVIEICDSKMQTLGFGQAACASEDFLQNESKSGLILIHANFIVLI